jgi:hypothetical protein
MLEICQLGKSLHFEFSDSKRIDLGLSTKARTPKFVVYGSWTSCATAYDGPRWVIIYALLGGSTLSAHIDSSCRVIGTPVFVPDSGQTFRFSPCQYSVAGVC